MLITRKTKVPKSWAFFAQLIIILSIYGQFVIQAPFILLIKKYIDNPAAIMGLISLQIYLTFVIGPLIAWLSDRIWTRVGRRKVFVAISDFLRFVFLVGMPFAPNLWILILLRWMYDFFGDLAAPAQALVYEVVPAKQRGLSSGFMQAFMNIGNLVFFTLLLGRFHDVYFMGPFQFFATPSGGTLMFIICGLLFLGAAIFEAIGIKEIYPVGRKRLMDGRKKGENFFRHFIRSVFKDIFAKDLTPLYLLLFANVMFGFSLGVFQPLLFTEQWGYDLQTFGNTIAIGVPVGIVLGLLGGWMADRFGKMKIVFWATTGNLVVNILYTVYVYFLPDYRPSFWEIVAFGNAAWVFGAVKGVATGPLLWEYVARNRMGGATAGIQIFNAIFRNSIGVVLGGWLFLWSLWFFPQAGYNLTATFGEELSREEVREKARSAGLATEQLYLRPVHQPGVDGKTSERWWIHREDEQAQEWIDEREDLQNRLSHLEGKKEGFFTSEERKAEIGEEMADARARIEEIEASLEDRSRELERRLAPELEELRFRPGEQLLAARLDGDALYLEVRTIERLKEEQIPDLLESLRGQELEMKAAGEGNGQRLPDIEVNPLQREDGGHALAITARLDPRFVDLFYGASRAGLRSDRAFNLATALKAVSESQFRTREKDYRIRDVAGSAPDGPEAPARLAFTVDPNGGTGKEAPTTQEVKDLYQTADGRIRAATVRRENGAYRLELELDPQDATEKETQLPYAEVRSRMAGELGRDGPRRDLAMAVFRKFAETLAARPLYVTIPRHQMEADYSDREYEYYFSSQLLQIGTDIIGLGILAFILLLEKRGVLHRYGAEEDDNR